VQFAQFIREKRFRAVLGHEDAQLVLRVNPPGFCASLNQSRARAVVLGKEERFLENLAEHRDKGQFEQRQERRLMRFEDFGKLCRTKPRRFHGQCVWRFKAEL
jgi:hypothetical protein